MAILLIAVGVLILAFGVRSIMQPRWNRPPLFWSPISAGGVFAVGIGLLAAGVLLL